VTGCPHHTFQHHVEDAKKRLADHTINTTASLFATNQRDPVGILITSGCGQKRALDFICTREDQRRRGLGRAMLEKVIEALREQSAESLVASNVNSTNAAALGLLGSIGFEGKRTGGIRMRRPLDVRLPPYRAPEGITIRPIAPGEEAAWCTLINACFAAEGLRKWTVDDFHREFTRSPIFDRSRIFVALESDRLIGTATAWEADYGEGPIGLIHWVGTHPECRGKGVGYAINLCALERLAALGYADAWLNTGRQRADAVRLYERLGFYIHREFVQCTRNLKT